MHHWKKIALAKQAERAARLKLNFTVAQDGPAGRVLADAVYTAATAKQIVQHIRDEDSGWTAERVLAAFARQATKAHEATTCLTEVMFSDAFEEARKLDEEFARTKRTKGPLHGVPISFKDMYNVKGHDTTNGFTAYCEQPAKEDGEIVKQVRAAGGIPFVKTNVPQTLLSFECANPLFGRTTNPWNERYTSGGSSGGEGALLACDGSALGFGSDVAGSLRIPTSYCGIYALKPGYSRTSDLGIRHVRPGYEGIKESRGPMGRSVEDIELGAQVIFDNPNSLDVCNPPLGYREVKLPKKLKFGYYKSDALVRSSPAVQRAVQETVDALRREGHECVEFMVPDQLESLRLYFAISSSDQLQSALVHLGPDPKDVSLTLPSIVPKIPMPIRKSISWTIKNIAKDPIVAKLLMNLRGCTVGEYIDHIHARDQYRQRFLKEVWEAQGFDGIICPVQTMPTIPHGASADVAFICSSTLLYNVVDHPVGVVPVTRVDKSKDTLTAEWEESGDRGSPLMFGKLYRGPKAFYDAEKMHGIPVGVQIVGRVWEDEKVVKMMRVVDDALGVRGFGPGAWTKSSEVEVNVN